MWITDDCRRMSILSYILTNFNEFFCEHFPSCQKEQALLH